MADIREGMTVYSADGEKLGKIIQRRGDTIVIEKGFFFPKEYVCSMADVRDVRDGSVILSSSKTELGAAFDEGTADRATGPPAISAGVRPDVRVPLKEEQLEVQKRARQGGEVRVVKEVVTERKHVQVPVTREEVHVERVPASGAPAASDERIAGDTVRVPVREEEIQVTKRPVVREEVRVSKQAHTEQRDVDETVRKEKAKVERDTRPGAYASGPDRDLDE